MQISETDLPHIGKKLSIRLPNHDRVDVLIRSGGARELYLYAAGREEPTHVLMMDAAAACALGAALCVAVHAADNPVPGPRET